MSEPSGYWRPLFHGSVPKDIAFPSSNEDKLRCCKQNHVYVMSDGASESYNSALWADVLVQSVCSELPRSHFVRWLKRAIADYEKRSHLATLSWSQEAAFARGSFASLLVVELNDDHIALTAIGDTTAILVEEGAISRTFPYAKAEEFQQRPHLLSTLRSRHGNPYFRQALRSLVCKSTSVGCRTTWPYPTSQESFLLCVTDALGEWLLRQDDNWKARLDSILGVRSEEELIRVIEEARRGDRMRRDDSSLIILGAGHATANA